MVILQQKLSWFIQPETHMDELQSRARDTYHLDRSVTRPHRERAALQSLFYRSFRIDIKRPNPIFAFSKHDLSEHIHFH